MSFLLEKGNFQPAMLDYQSGKCPIFQLPGMYKTI